MPKITLPDPGRLPLASGTTNHRINWRWVMVIFMSGIFVFGWSVGNAPIASTEGHRALVGHQMLQQGEYLITTLFGRIYQTKPPLQPLTIALSEHLFSGPSEFAWRFPSVFGAAFLAAFLAAMGDRWFGRPAGLISGFTSLGMVVLWEQNRTADIDSMNTMVSVIAACCIIEVFMNRPKWPILWAIFGGLALGASLLYKGPAGLPVIGGALIGSILAAWMAGKTSPAIEVSNNARAGDESADPGPSPSLEMASVSTVILSHPHAPAITPNDPAHPSTRWHWLRRPWFLLILAIGGGCFWMVMHAIAVEMARRGLVPDRSGIEEAERRMLATNAGTILKALLVPFTLLAFSMPVSLLASYAVFSRKGWHSADRRQRNLIRALGLSMLGAFVIGIIAGITNYRYGYVSLPLLCLLAGAAYKVHESWLASERGRKQALVLLIILGMVYFGAFVFFGVLGYANAPDRPSIMIAGALAMMGLSALWRGRDFGWRVRGACLLMIVLAVPFALWKNAESRVKSGQALVGAIHRSIPVGATVTTGRMLMTQPEIFYYARLNVVSYGDGLKDPVPLPTAQWILFNDKEYAAWDKVYPGQLASVTKLATDRHTSYLVYYDPSLPAATQPMKRASTEPMTSSTTRPMTPATSGHKPQVILELMPPAATQPAMTQPASR